MGAIYLDYDQGIPRFVCTDCDKCNSIFGKNLCGLADRGCCHYFPEFMLADIHRMVHIPGGTQSLNIIISNPNTVINNYNIIAKGFFDKNGYENYLNKDDLIEPGTIKDQTYLFKACPFVIPGQGCTLLPRFRPTVCSFFICSEIFEQFDLKNDLKTYIEERTRYSRWIYKESTELQYILTANGVNLSVDFNGSLDILKAIPLNVYEFPALPHVEF